MLVGLIGRDGAHHFAVTQDGDAAAGSQHLAQLVRDENDGFALAHQAAQDVEQPAHLLRREHRRRLIEDQHPCAAVERLQDFDTLLLAHR